MQRRLVLTFIALSLILSLSLFCFIGCTPENNGDNNDKKENVVINVSVPDGSPAITIAKLLQDKPTFDGYMINYEVLAGDNAPTIAARMASGQANIVIAPTNAGAVQYNKANSYKLLATSTQGSLYMVGKNALNGNTIEEKLNALKGKVLYNIGQGGTPDATMQYVLKHYNVPFEITDVVSNEYIALQYVADGPTLIGFLKQGKAEYGILGEPAVTNANAKTGTQTLLSLTDLWNAASSSNKGFPQASVFVKSDLTNGEHDTFLNWFINKLEESVQWAPTHASEATTALTQAGSLSLNNLTNDMILKCNLEIITATSAKTAVNDYLTTLYDLKPALIGGSIPNDGFYYSIH